MKQIPICHAGCPGLVVILEEPKLKAWRGGEKPLPSSPCVTPKVPWASLVAQMVKNSPTRQETWAQSLGLEDPLEKGTATQANILTWRISWTEEPGGLQSMRSQRVEQD